MLRAVAPLPILIQAAFNALYRFAPPCAYYMPHEHLTNIKHPLYTCKTN